MDYKKAYDDALERAKQGLPIDEVFPEMKESEDERIRKQLINEVKEQIENIPAPDCCDSDDLQRLTILQSWLAYLEKQKEQKDYRKLYEDIAQSEWFKKAYVGKSLSGEFEQKPLSIEETELNSIAFLEQLGYTCIPPGAKPTEWSEEDERMLKMALECLDYISCQSKVPVVNWLKSLRSKSHWKPSGQEKGALKTAIYVLREERNFPKAAGHLQAILDAFEDKESRKDWKPSEEQMKQLKDAAGLPEFGPMVTTKKQYPALASLYNDLQKLL